MAKARGVDDIFLKLPHMLLTIKNYDTKSQKKSWALSGFAPDCISMCVKITDE